MSIVDSSLWKPVPIDVEGDFEGLIGFEEITDYNIETYRQHSKKLKSTDNNKEKKKKKTKILSNRTTENVANSVKKNVFIEENVEEHCFDEEDYYPWTNICVPKDIAKSLLEKGFTEPTEIQVLYFVLTLVALQQTLV